MNLIRKSNIFLVMALNHVFPHWHRGMELGKVIALAKAVKVITNNRESKLIFRRLYIHEPSGKTRPLGIPTPA